MPGSKKKPVPAPVRTTKRRTVSKDASRAMRAKFVERYIATNDGTQAALDAGYGDGNRVAAKQAAYKLKKIPEVQAEIAKRQAQLQERFALETDRVLAELAAIVYLDPRRIIMADGSLLPIPDWPESIARAVSGIEVATKKRGNEYLEVLKVKFADKNSAIEKAMRHLGLFEKDNRQQPNAIADLLAHVALHNQQIPIQPCSPAPTTSPTGPTSAGD